MRCASCGVSGSTSGAQLRGWRGIAGVDDRQELARRFHLMRQLLVLLPECRQLRFAQQLLTKPALVVRELSIDVGGRDGTLLHVVHVPLQEVMNGLDSDPD